MIVLDASAAIEWLLQTSTGLRVGRRIFATNESLHAPHLLDVEITQALRRLVAMHGLTLPRASQVVQDLSDARIHRYAHTSFLGRIWSLRANLTAYDGVYIALAEALGAPLVTCDARLGHAPGHRARVEVL